MKRKELERLVQGMADCVLTEEELDILQTELRNNASSRAFFRESMRIELLLNENTQVRVPETAIQKTTRHLSPRQGQRQLKWSVLTAAAVLVLSALILKLIFVRKPDSNIKMAFTPGTSWSGNIGDDQKTLPLGESINIEFGVSEVRLPGDVTGIIEGPAEFQVIAHNLLELRSGVAWFRVGEAGQGFQVQTPYVKVKDLGTEFGIITRPDKLDEVHVFEGRVEATARFALKEQEEITAGHAAKVSPVGRWIDEASDETAFLKQLPSSLPGIFFTFDGEDPLRPEGEHPAVASMKVRTRNDEAPTLVEGVRGLALQQQKNDDTLITDWRGIGGDDPRTVACWIRLSKQSADLAVILTWGDNTKLAPERSRLLVVKTPNGHYVPRFSLGHDVRFVGSTPLQLDRWHHVAVVFHGSHHDHGDMVAFYVDGKADKADLDFSKPPQEDLVINTVIDSDNSMPFQIGFDPDQDEIDEIKLPPYRGAIDEVRIFPRALSASEIQDLMREDLLGK